MLPIEYQEHVRAILFVSAAQIKANGKFKSSKVKRHPRVKTAALASAALTRAGAPYKKNQAEAWAKGDIENQCFKFIRQLHKELKAKGLAVLPAVGAAVVPAIAMAAPKVMRRDVVAGIGAFAMFGTGLLFSSAAQATHDHAWLEVKPDLAPFIASLREEVIAAITG